MQKGFIFVGHFRSLTVSPGRTRKSLEFIFIVNLSNLSLRRILGLNSLALAATYPDAGIKGPGGRLGVSNRIAFWL